MDLASSRILIGDDQNLNIAQIEFILDSAGFRQHRHTTNPSQVLHLCSSFRPDLLVLDFKMADQDGFSVAAYLAHELPHQSYLPILMFIADNAEAKRKALSSGANDFLCRPPDPSELVLRVTNLLRIRWLYAELRRHQETLESEVRERTRRFAEGQLEILDRLAIAAEYRDDVTGQHTHRVGNLAAVIARELGQPEDQIELLRIAARLHDVGNIGVPDRVLLKHGKLTGEEFEIIKSHTNIGTEILGRSKLSILRVTREIAASHHEKWDGSGYPQGLKGDSIPLSGRIVAIADVFDVLTHQRRYKEAWSLQAAVEEMKRQSTRQFDPKLIDLFLSLVETAGVVNFVKRLETETGDKRHAVSLL